MSIRNFRSRRFHFVGKSTFSIGCTKDDDVIVNFPGNKHGSLDVKNGCIIKDQTSGNRINDHSYSSHDILIKILHIRTIPLIMVSLVLFCITWFSAFHDKVPKQDWTPVSLPADETFGFCRQDKSHPYGLRVVIPASHENSGKILFTPGGEIAGGSLLLLLDGIPYANRIPIPEGWGQELAIEIPESRTQDPRIIEFRTIQTSNTLMHWGVRDVKFIPGALESNSGGKRSQINEGDFFRLADMKTDSPYFWIVLQRLSSRLKAEKDTRLAIKLFDERKKAEERIRQFLDRELLIVRSFRSSDNWPEAKKHLSRIRKLIPVEWRQGHRIFDESEK